MKFKNLLRSSKLEIITSKRITAFVYLFLGLAVIVWWSGSLWQFFYAYIVYKEFDAPVLAFLVITLVFFFPLFLTGCWILSGVIQRQRILLWIKQSLVVADYQTQLGPATAGLLIDYEYNVSEIWGTLLKLHFQGNIELNSHINSLKISYIHSKRLGRYESMLLEEIFLYQTEVEIYNLRDSTVVNAGLIAHEQLAKDLAQIGAYEVNNANSIKYSRIVKTIYGLAGFTAVLQVSGMLFGGDEYWGINYPRYDVSIIQPVTLIAATTIGLLIILTGFRYKFSNINKSRPTTLLLQSSGFYAYLKNVYRRRLSEEYIQTQAVKDVRALTPYVIAYRLQPLNMRYIKIILEHTSKI